MTDPADALVTAVRTGADVRPLLETDLEPPAHLAFPPLMAAAAWGRPDVVELLLARGVRPTHRALAPAYRGMRRNPARAQDYRRTLDILHRALAAIAQARTMDGVEMLCDAARDGDSRRVTELIGMGVPVDERNVFQRTALDHAIGSDRPHVVRLLVAAGADPEQLVGPERRDTPLLHAIGRGRGVLARALLEGGADPGHSPDVEGITRRTPVAWAATCGQTSIVRLLVERGVDLDVPPEVESGNPLFDAAYHGHAALVEYLLGVGMRPALITLAWALDERDLTRERRPPSHLPVPEQEPDYERTIDLLRAWLTRAGVDVSGLDE